MAGNSGRRYQYYEEIVLRKEFNRGESRKKSFKKIYEKSYYPRPFAQSSVNICGTRISRAAFSYVYPFHSAYQISRRDRA